MKTPLTATSRSIAAAAVAVVLLIGFTAAKAPTPAEQIQAAIAAAGSSAAKSDAAGFVKAFSAVVVRGKQTAMPEYVTAAIKLRPDLAPQITVAALRVSRHRIDEQLSCDWLKPIIRAAILASPKAAVAIAKASCTVEPDACECITAAAIQAAPDQREALLQASSETESLSSSIGPLDNGSNSPAGSINPANIGNSGNTVSPERNDRATICHSGNTLVLPNKAAMEHLQHHPGDYPGSCR